MRVAKIIFLFLLFFLAVTFSLQNTETVKIHYFGLFESLGAPFFSVILAALSLGIIIGAVGGLLTNIRLRIELRRQTKEVERLRKESERLPDLAIFPPSEE